MPRVQQFNPHPSILANNEEWHFKEGGVTDDNVLFISVLMRTKVVREWTLVLNRHSKIPEVILAHLLLIKIGNRH